MKGWLVGESAQVCPVASSSVAEAASNRDGWHLGRFSCLLIQFYTSTVNDIHTVCTTSGMLLAVQTAGNRTQ